MIEPIFERRFGPCRERLFGYAMALTRDRDQASDLFQDCVVRAMSASAQPDCDRAFKSWLFVILRNLWRDRLRAERRSRVFAKSNIRDEPAEAPVSLETVIVNQLAVRQAMAMLSADHRDVLGLVDVAGFSYEETAGILQVPAGTVMSRIARARKALCALLTDNKVADLALPRKEGRNG